MANRDPYGEGWFVIIKLEDFENKQTVLLSSRTRQDFWNSQGCDKRTIAGASIGIQVVDARNDTIFLDIVYSDFEGNYSDSFRLQTTSLYGACNVHASAYSPGYPIVLANSTFWITCLGDINGDRNVDIFDIVIIAIHFGETS